MASHKLVSMKLSAADREKRMEGPATSAPEGPRYPWGLSLSLDNDVLERLDVDTLPEVGAELTLVATVTVTRVSSSDHADGGTSREVALQITDMLLGEGKRAGTADVLFGGKKE